MTYRAIIWLFLTQLIAAIHTQAIAAIHIEYIDFTPSIDGQLDQPLQGLAFHQFKHYYDFGDPVEQPVKVRYKLAYNHQYLYVYIETDANRITYNKRGYLYGDGYKIILGKSSPKNTTAEYHDIAYSPNQDKSQRDRQVRATYNGQHINQALSALSKSGQQAFSDHTGFEALISWQDVHPLNPLFDQQIGLNLYFAKSISTKDTLGYSIIKDESIWDESLLVRQLQAVTFGPAPKSLKATQIRQRNYRQNEPIQVHSHGLTTDDQALVMIEDAQGQQWLKSSLELGNSTPASTHLIQPPELPPGHYQLSVVLNDQQQTKQPIAILPTMDFKQLRNQLDSQTTANNQGAVSTLSFHLQQLTNMSQQLKPYELGTELMQYWTTFKQAFAVFQQGQDPYATKPGPYRRAFKSNIDGSLQPYTIKLPENYNPKRTYPLLVFLHGSGQDEQKLLHQARADGQFIELAPLGRDLFRAYSFAASQQDIVEAIEDVKKHFPVDANQVIIGGFSMGGYGALRAFYTHPELYQGVAVFAGHPDLANQWGVPGEHPNFLLPEHLSAFKQRPVFIYHGTADEAIDFKLAEQLKSALESAGATVTHRFVAGRDHRYQDAASHAIYQQWLKQFHPRVD